MDDNPSPEDEVAPRHFADMLAISGRCSFLLVALVALITFYPFLDVTQLFDRLLMGVLNSAIMVAGAVAASRRRRTWFIALALAVPTLVLQWVDALTGSRAIELAFLATVVVFYVFTIANILTYVLGPGPVIGDKIHGAVAAYILTGLMWASIYLLADRLIPGSFLINGVSDRGTPMTWEHLVFFSFTTFTSTGYGWVVPASPHTQSLAILEQLAGVFYVAVLIARLAGLYQPAAGPGSGNGIVGWHRLRHHRGSTKEGETP